MPDNTSEGTAIPLTESPQFSRNDPFISGGTYWFLVPPPIETEGAFVVNFSTDGPETYGLVTLYTYDDGVLVDTQYNNYNLNYQYPIPNGYGYSMSTIAPGRTWKIGVTHYNSVVITVNFGVSTTLLYEGPWITGSAIHPDSDLDPEIDREYFLPRYDSVNGDLVSYPRYSGASANHDAATPGRTVDHAPFLKGQVDVAAGGWGTSEGIFLSSQSSGYGLQYYYDGGTSPGTITENMIGGYYTYKRAYEAIYLFDEDARAQLRLNPVWKHRFYNGIQARFGSGLTALAIQNLLRRNLSVQWEQDLNTVAGHDSREIFDAAVVMRYGVAWKNSTDSDNYFFSDYQPTPNASGFDYKSHNITPDVETLTVGWVAPATYSGYPIIESDAIPATGISGVIPAQPINEPIVLKSHINVHTPEKVGTAFLTTHQTGEATPTWEANNANREAALSGIIMQMYMEARPVGLVIERALYYPRYKIKIWSPDLTIHIIPPMRQLQRDDNLVNEAPRAFRVGASLQSNLRSGGGVYY